MIAKEVTKAEIINLFLMCLLEEHAMLAYGTQQVSPVDARLHQLDIYIYYNLAIYDVYKSSEHAKGP